RYRWLSDQIDCAGQIDDKVPSVRTCGRDRCVGRVKLRMATVRVVRTASSSDELSPVPPSNLLADEVGNAASVPAYPRIPRPARGPGCDSGAEPGADRPGESDRACRRDRVVPHCRPSPPAPRSIVVTW